MDIESKYKLLDEIEKSNLPPVYKKNVTDLVKEHEVDNGSLLLTQQEAYKLLGVGRTTFYSFVQAGVITPIEIGGVSRIKRADINELVDNSVPKKRKQVTSKKKAVSQKKVAPKKRDGAVTACFKCESSPVDQDVILVKEKYFLNIDILLKNIDLLI